MKRVALVALSSLFAIAPVAAQAPGGADAAALEDLAFLSGCWRGTYAGGAGVIEEFYTSPSKNLMLGTTRYLRDGRAAQYEFTRIEKTDAGIVMTPYPGGKPSEHGFRLTSLRDGEAIFEAPEHDFPKRIIYRRNADGTRTARIDGGAASPKAQEWRMSAAACTQAK